MEKKIVLDLETQRTFEEVGGRNYEDLLVSVVGIYRYDTHSYECYLENEIHHLENLLIDCDLLIGFNHRKFDLPVLQRYLHLSGAELPMLDIMEDIANTIGHRVSLDSVAQATLQIGKTGHGLDAIEFYRKGEWDKLKAYCLNDVKITKEVYEYGMKHGHVYYLTRDGMDRKSVKVQWAEKEEESQAAAGAGQYNLAF
ncbi:MAG: ribonuclease H-like domain-containing protein [bacterium]|nr:ribonuclease H-like domain-containing protein [bacterium]